MRARGKVTKIENAMAWVEVCHKETCVGCGMHNPDDTMAEIQCVDNVGVSVGQRVEFEVNRSKMLGVMLIVFWLPLILAGLFAWGASAAAQSLPNLLTVLTWLSGILGFGLGVFAVYKIGKKTSAGTGLHIVRIVPDEEAQCAGGTCGGLSDG